MAEPDHRAFDRPAAPARPPHTLYFIRHGETDWNAEGRLQGWKDIPLNDYGLVQAEEIGRFLAGRVAGLAELGFVASPLGRARQTMETMRIAMGLPADDYRVDERLKELNFGRWEGLTWREVLGVDAALAAARERDKWNTVPPDGESYEMLAARLMPFLASIDRDTVIVSHGGIGRTFYALLAGRSKQTAADTYIRQGVAYIFARGDVRAVTPYEKADG